MNPFSLVYDQILADAKNNRVLQKYIRAANYQDFKTKSFPKQSISSADLPELALLCTGLTGNLTASSSSVQVDVGYGWLLTSGSFDYTGLTAEIMWGLLGASSAWCGSLSKLVWNDRTFVRNTVLGEANCSIQSEEGNRGISGWTADWQLTVTMYFSHIELKDLQCPDP